MTVLIESYWLQQTTAPQQKLYLFHPSYTNVLLELRNNTDQIIAFNGKSWPCSPPAGSCRRTPTPGTSWAAWGRSGGLVDSLNGDLRLGCSLCSVLQPRCLSGAVTPAMCC